jgi:hypothetical protein
MIGFCAFKIGVGGAERRKRNGKKEKREKFRSAD